MNTPADSQRFLRSLYRRTRGLWLVWSLAFALLGVILAGCERLGWWAHGTLAGSVASAVAAVLIGGWWWRFRRITPADLARALDARWGLSARLETSGELAGDDSALARAQQADTASRLAGRTPPRAAAWRTGLALLAVVMLVLLTQVVTLTVRRSMPSPEIPAPAKAAENISAAITWKTPDSEIKATAIEEVPLTAQAVTRTGFRTVTLEVSVNGEPRLSRPLDAAALAALAKPGEHPVELSLYLDEVGAHDYDIVAYYLSGDRATRTPAPRVMSPLQLVEIRPARDDAALGKAGSGAGKVVALILQLKIAQLQLLKQNFVLAHASLDRTDPIWREENTRVANDQAALAKKTGEVREFAITQGMPVLVVDNLSQVIPLMETAAKEIAAPANESAVKPQGRALALITEIEKLIVKIVAPPSSGAAKPPPTDPFKDKQAYKLPPREQTPAGELEKLAQAQADAAKKLDAPAQNPGDAAKTAAQQAALAQKAADLAASKKLDPAAQPAAEQAAKDAAEAARQLAQNDPEAARAPAEAAAADLRAAVAAQEKGGRATAQAALEAARREINAAERNPDDAARAAALAAVAENLRAEARAQQETGSAEAARQLAKAASDIQKAAARKPGETPGDAPAPGQGQGKGEGKGQGEGQGQDPGKGKGQGFAPGEGSGPGAGKAPGAPGGSGAGSAAQAAARAQAAITPRGEALAHAERQLERARADSGTAPAAVPAEALAEIELATQLAAQLSADPAILDRTHEIEGALHDSGGVGNVVVPAALFHSVDELIVALAAARTAGGRDEQVRRFNPEDVDPAYRDAVDAYFEKLSREGVKR